MDAGCRDNYCASFRQLLLDWASPAHSSSEGAAAQEAAHQPNNSARTQIPGRTARLLWPVDLLGVAECHFLPINISINPAVCSINFSLCPPLNDVPLEPLFALWESGMWCGRPWAIHWKSDTMMICFWPFSRTKIFHLQRKSNSSPRTRIFLLHFRLCGAFLKRKKMH